MTAGKAGTRRTTLWCGFVDHKAGAKLSDEDTVLSAAAPHEPMLFLMDGAL